MKKFSVLCLAFVCLAAASAQTAVPPAANTLTEIRPTSYLEPILNPGQPVNLIQCNSLLDFMCPFPGNNVNELDGFVVVGNVNTPNQPVTILTQGLLPVPISVPVNGPSQLGEILVMAADGSLITSHQSQVGRIPCDLIVAGSWEFGNTLNFFGPHIRGGLVTPNCIDKALFSAYITSVVPAGAQGPQGQQGIQGMMGVPGAKGATGPVGPAGALPSLNNLTLTGFTKTGSLDYVALTKQGAATHTVNACLVSAAGYAITLGCTIKGLLPTSACSYVGKNKQAQDTLIGTTPPLLGNIPFVTISGDQAVLNLSTRPDVSAVVPGAMFQITCDI